MFVLCTLTKGIDNKNSQHLRTCHAPYPLTHHSLIFSTVMCVCFFLGFEVCVKCRLSKNKVWICEFKKEGFY